AFNSSFQVRSVFKLQSQYMVNSCRCTIIAALERTSNSFHWAERHPSLVVAHFCSVGIYFALSGGKQKTTAEYLIMRLVPVSVSLVASFLSAILILGHPAEIYLNGIGFHFHLIGATIAYLTTAFLFVGLFYQLRITSAFEYLEQRFQSKLVRCIGTLLVIISHSELVQLIKSNLLY
uniref:DUF418 domain-containing protein n=1 Tax=Macrostomum lignano TaxID=282301 RepID=A0A1I8HK47_9PLAT